MHTDSYATQHLLTIGELAAQTGLAPATLRMWEARHGFPVADRLPSGHRRYRPEVVTRVRAVLDRQGAGVRLDAAIAGVVSDATAPPTPQTLSVFAELRRTNPHLAPQVLQKSSLVAISQALEDECVAQAGRAVFFGAFQQRRHLRASWARWTDLARTARATFAFSVADDAPLPDSAIIHVPLADDALMRREWSVVCDGIGQPAALSAWELPGQEDVPDARRRFEAIWTLDPTAVRDAARTCAHVALDSGINDLRNILSSLNSPAEHADPDATTRMSWRMVAYLEQRNR